MIDPAGIVHEASAVLYASPPPEVSSADVAAFFKRNEDALVSRTTQVLRAEMARRTPEGMWVTAGVFRAALLKVYRAGSFYGSQTVGITVADADGLKVLATDGNVAAFIPVAASHPWSKAPQVLDRESAEVLIKALKKKGATELIHVGAGLDRFSSVSVDGLPITKIHHKNFPPLMQYWPTHKKGVALHVVVDRKELIRVATTLKDDWKPRIGMLAIRWEHAGRITVEAPEAPPFHLPVEGGWPRPSIAGINVVYLLDALSAFDCPKVRIRQSPLNAPPQKGKRRKGQPTPETDLDPFEFSAVDPSGPEPTWLVMPMRLDR